MDLAYLIIGVVTAQRLGELILSRRNTRRLIASGAVAYASAHYPFMVALHATWLAGLWWLTPGQPISIVLLVVYAALRILRVWVMATLGPRWTTRIVVLPGAPLVKTGPYRFLSHPNYVVVVCEFALLPLMFGLVWYAVLFSLLNAAVLAIRIRAENAALDQVASSAHPECAR